MVEDDLLVVAASGFLLCCLEKSCSYALSTPRLLHPQLPDLAAPTPGMTTNACNDSILLIPHEDCQALAIPDACRSGVELVEAIFQVLNLFGCRIGLDREW